MHRTAFVLAMVVAGCGGSQLTAKSDQGGALTPGLKCLDLARIPRSAAKDAPSRLDVSHIVVRYAGVRNAGEVTRTREEACLRAQAVRDKLLAGGDWDALYEEYSDSKDAAKGAFHSAAQEDLEEDFGNAAFALKVDELSHVVETGNGFHVIWRMK